MGVSIWTTFAEIELRTLLRGIGSICCTIMVKIKNKNSKKKDFCKRRMWKRIIKDKKDASGEIGLEH